ncbi:MAG: restriction endonuclease subunit S [Treponema sp.]|nr:restriction endonuclease subunit S [Treponema sp.]
MEKRKLIEMGTLSRGRSQHRPRNDSKLYGGKYPFIQTGDVKNSNLYIEKYSQTYNDFGLNQSKLWPENTLCITIAANIADTGILSFPACFPDSIIGFTATKGKTDVRYVKYCFDLLQKSIQNMSKGSTQDNLSMEKLEQLEFNCPSFENQQKIAAVLSSLDDKIALNNRINAKLEQMAKRLYEHWFVQFDFPVSCHSELVSESHSEEMLNQVQHDECAKPYKSTGGKMVWNEELKREIPEGWEVKKLGEIALVKRGTTITEKDTTKGNVKVVAGGLDFSYYHNQSNRKANCITVSGSGENAGFVNFWREPIFASDCSTAQCENDIDTMLCYFALKMQEKRFYRISHKSAQPHIYPKDVAEIPIVVPNEAVKSKISDFFLKSNWKIALIEKETQKLTALRDRLLPLLMNGQVEVK